MLKQRKRTLIVDAANQTTAIDYQTDPTGFGSESESNKEKFKSLDVTCLHSKQAQFIP